ncbi:MAG TPA: response regulator, partial [Vicinamibacterales bacterium]|nr:response regulator [Vicinamibacterales bacterium]
MVPLAGMNDVLVVDDEQAIRQLLVRWLTQWGYRTRSAASANDAIEQMAAQPASILISDVMMPIRDGIWLAEQVHRRWPTTAVIIASASGDLETVMALRRHGVIDYVMKPLGREMVRQALDRARARQTSSPAATPGVAQRLDAEPRSTLSSIIRSTSKRAAKVLDRHDTPLGVALIVATVMVFHQPLRFLFDVATELETRYRVDLIPALTMLSVAFGFHQYRKRQETRNAAAIAQAEARRAAERTEELERLVGLSRALANAFTLETISRVLARYIPQFTDTRDEWLLTHTAGRWEP